MDLTNHFNYKIFPLDISAMVTKVPKVNIWRFSFKAGHPHLLFLKRVYEKHLLLCLLF